MKINYMQLSMKAHFFFFLATIGSFSPFIAVYAKQLGISPLIMGTINAILPLLFMIIKPIIGIIMDYFQSQKKLIFMIVLIITSSSYILLYFLPSLPEQIVRDHQFENVSCASFPFCSVDSNSSVASYDSTNTCYWVCKDTNFTVQSFHIVEKKAVISSNRSCMLNIVKVPLCQEETTENYNCNVTCTNLENNHIYTSVTFWGFVILLSFGNIGINISMCISDAICLEILGKGKELKFGMQRLWGAFGYGLAAFLTGYTVDIWSQGKSYKSYTSAFLLVFIFSCIDLICCRKLKLPLISRSANIFADICVLLKCKSIVIFLCFVIIIGAFDGYISSFLLWYEEDLAMKTGYINNIKLIEGLTLAAGAFGSETLFMLLSGKILKKLGYGYTFIFSFVSYTLRLGLISVVPTPWWIVLIEFLMRGPSYPLFHATSVSFASAISSPSISVSIQGILAGMKEGFGFGIGNVMGSILLKKFGGALTFQIFSIFASLCALVYFLLYITYLKHKIPGTQNNVEWRTPDDAQKHCIVAEL